MHTPASRAGWVSLCAAGLVLLVLGAFSFAFATHFTFRFQPLRFMDHYRYQANGWSRGHLFLMSNEGREINCVDCASFRSHVWLAYGPLPAVIQLVLNYGLHTKVTSTCIVWLLGFSTLCLFFWFSRYVLVHIHLARPPAATWMATAITLFAGTSERFLHSTTVGYAWSQAALASQLCLLLSAVCFFLFSTRRAGWWLIASGTFAGAALLGKQNYLANFIVTALFLVWMLASRKEPVRAIVIASLRFLTPVLLSIALLLWWNQLRFGYPLDSGVEYVNASEREPNTDVYPDYRRIPLNFYNQFLAGFEIQHRDLPVLLGLSNNRQSWDPDISLLHNYPMFSLFLAMPVLLVVPVYVVYRLIRWRKWRPPDFWFFYFVALATAVFTPYLLLDSSWSRYQYDLVYLWTLASALVLFRVRRTMLLTGLLLGALCWQTFVAVDQTLGLLFSRSTRLIHWTSSERESDIILGERVRRFLGIT